MTRATFWVAVTGLAIAPAAARADGRACCGETPTASVSPCTVRGACNGCASDCRPACEKRAVQCCHNRTKYRLVKECRPVCRERVVRTRDACDPCSDRQTVVTECKDRTRYRWVAETRPVCHTKTVKVCHQPADWAHRSDDPVAAAAPHARNNVQLTAATPR